MMKIKYLPLVIENYFSYFKKPKRRSESILRRIKRFFGRLFSRRKHEDSEDSNEDMGFFTTAIAGLTTVVTAIGAGIAVWGIINLLEGYGQDNASSKSQGIKQLMAGGGIVIIAQTVIPQLSGLFS